MSKEYDPPLDDGIAAQVMLLNEHGVETFQSCDGEHPGAAAPEPTIEFHGDNGEGFRALCVALRSIPRVRALRRVWNIHDGTPVGPHWEIVLWPLNPRR